MPPLVKIRSERDHMSAIERRIADFILDNAHLLRDYSSQQLASALGISQSSVVKFSQKLGFKGYPDLKYSIGQAVARAGSDAGAGPPATEAGDDYAQIADRLRLSRSAADEETRLANAQADVEAIVRLVDGRRRSSCTGWATTGCMRANSRCGCRCWACSPCTTPTRS
jgi:DNA-binding MurR/RpiR family transcriptional regulator